MKFHEVASGYFKNITDIISQLMKTADGKQNLVLLRDYTTYPYSDVISVAAITQTRVTRITSSPKDLMNKSRFEKK